MKKSDSSSDLLPRPAHNLLSGRKLSGLGPRLDETKQHMKNCPTNCSEHALNVPFTDTLYPLSLSVQYQSLLPVEYSTHSTGHGVFCIGKDHKRQHKKFHGKTNITDDIGLTVGDFIHRVR